MNLQVLPGVRPTFRSSGIPSNLAIPVGWFDYRSGFSPAQWQSKAGGLVATQAAAGKQPASSAAGIVFEQSSGMLLTSSLDISANRAFTVMMEMSLRTLDGNWLFNANVGDGGGQLAQVSSYVYQGGIEAALNGVSHSRGNANVGQLWFAGDFSSIRPEASQGYINNSQVSTRSASGSARFPFATLQDFYLGNNGGTAEMTVRHYLLFSRLLTDQERQDWMSYIATT